MGTNRVSLLTCSLLVWTVWPCAMSMAQMSPPVSSMLPGGHRNSGPSTSTISTFKHGQMPDHYLMLVNTAVASYMTEDKLRQFDKSPYDGIAVAFLHAYDTSPPPSV